MSDAMPEGMKSAELTAPASSTSAVEASTLLLTTGSEISKKDFVMGYAQPGQGSLIMKPNDPRLTMCDFFKKFNSIDSYSQNRCSDDGTAGTLPATITPQLMEYIHKWCVYHTTYNEESTDSEDEQLTEPERLVKEYLPDTKIPAFDEIFFQRMDMRTRMELMNAADFLACDKLLDNMGKFIAKKMTRKTPQALRRMFGIVETGLTEEDEKNFKDKFGWALIGCTDEVDEIDCIKLTPAQEAIVAAREAKAAGAKGKASGGIGESSAATSGTGGGTVGAGDAANKPKASSFKK